MQLTIGDFLNTLKKRRVTVFTVFLVSLIIYPIQFNTFQKNTSNIIFIIDNFENIAGGNITQSKTINVFKKKMLYGQELKDGLSCLVSNKEGFEGQNLECQIKQVSNNNLQKIKDDTIKFIKKEYISALKLVKRFSSDISRMESIYEDRKPLSIEEVEEIINKEISDNKYLLIDVLVKNNTLNLFKFLSYVILINSLMIGYLIITHPKMGL